MLNKYCLRIKKFFGEFLIQTMRLRDSSFHIQSPLSCKLCPIGKLQLGQFVCNEGQQRRTPKIVLKSKKDRITFKTFVLFLVGRQSKTPSEKINKLAVHRSDNQSQTSLTGWCWLLTGHKSFQGNEVTFIMSSCLCS